MFILCLCIECVSGICAHFPLWPFGVAELIGGYVIGAFWSLFTVAVDECHLFGDEFFGFCISRGSSERILGGRWFFRILDIPKCRVDFSVGELNKVLIGV